MNEARAGAAGLVSGAAVIRLDSTGDVPSEAEAGLPQAIVTAAGARQPRYGRFFPHHLARNRCRNDVTAGTQGLVELDLADARAALLDLLGRDQDLADVLIGLAEMGLQLEHALLQALEVVHQVA